MKNYKINYQLLAETGVLIDEAQNFEFEFGDGTFAAEFENCIKDCEVGNPQTFLMQGADVFGAYDGSAKKEIDIKELPQSIKKGSVIDFDLSNGETLMGTIESIAEHTAIVDFNHPLSAINISFIVEVLKKS